MTATSRHFRPLSSSKANARSWKPYPAYKPSGVEWLGDVPEGWEVRRSDRIIETERRQISPSQFADIEVYHYSIPAVQEHGTGILENGDDVASGKQRVTESVVMVSRLNPRKATVCRAEPQTALTIASTEFVALKARKCDLRFLEHLVNTEPFRQRLDSWVQSVTRSHQRVSPEHIYRFWNAWPTPAEQRAIADFLDRETGKIDRLVAKKRELIGKLKEQRAALISRAVTCGLNPNAKLKPSGVEWLGDVPEGWKISKVRFEASLVSKGTTPSTVGRDLVDDGIRFIKAENIQDNRVSETPEFFIDEDTDELLSRSRLSAADVLIVIAGATTGKVAVFDRTLLPANTNQAVCFVRLKNIAYSGLLAYWMSTKFIQDRVWTAAVQSAQPNLAMDSIRAFPCLVPPLPEQRAIADFLDRETGKIDRLVAKVEEAIGRLQEYRAALITAAVTGKIDVREAAGMGKCLEYPEPQSALRMVAEKTVPEKGTYAVDSEKGTA